MNYTHASLHFDMESIQRATVKPIKWGHNKQVGGYINIGMSSIGFDDRETLVRFMRELDALLMEIDDYVEPSQEEPDERY